MSSGARSALEAAPAEALPDVPREGLSLAALRAFAKAHAGTTHRLPDSEPLLFEQLTTAQVCAAIVKPATLVDGAGCTYAELLLAQARARGRVLLLRLRPGCGRVAVRALTFSAQDACDDARGQPHVARATRFVSHAWAYPFADLLSTLEAHTEHDSETAYFWIGACGFWACFRPVS